MAEACPGCLTRHKYGCLIKLRKRREKQNKSPAGKGGALCLVWWIILILLGYQLDGLLAIVEQVDACCRQCE